MLNKLEIQFWKIAKWLIRRNYGNSACRTYEGTCVNCKARKLIHLIDEHINLLKPY